MSATITLFVQTQATPVQLTALCLSVIVRAGCNVDGKISRLPVNMTMLVHFWFSVSCETDVRGYTRRAVLGIYRECHPVLVMIRANIKSRL